MAGVIWDIAQKSKQEGLRLGAAQFYMAGRGEWHERDGSTVSRLPDGMNGEDPDGEGGPWA